MGSPQPTTAPAIVIIVTRQQILIIYVSPIPCGGARPDEQTTEPVAAICPSARDELLSEAQLHHFGPNQSTDVV